jgi:hypothetical protein
VISSQNSFDCTVPRSAAGKYLAFLVGVPDKKGGWVVSDKVVVNVKPLSLTPTPRPVTPRISIHPPLPDSPVKADKTMGVQERVRAQGTLKVISNPPGAKVFINGRSTGKTTPYETRLDLGNYTLTLELNRYLRWEQNIKVEAAKIIEYCVELVPDKKTVDENHNRGVGILTIPEPKNY